MKKYIYFISLTKTIKINIPACIKIGLSSSPITRLKTFQTGNHRKLYLIGIIQLPAHDGYRIERRLHEIYSQKKIRGEWFRLNLSDLNFIKKILRKL